MLLYAQNNLYTNFLEEQIVTIPISPNKGLNLFLMPTFAATSFR